jgi:hypothetical protein
MFHDASRLWRQAVRHIKVNEQIYENYHYHAITPKANTWISLSLVILVSLASLSGGRLGQTGNLRSNFSHPHRQTVQQNVTDRMTVEG